jgi:hypothetical protein
LIEEYTRYTADRAEWRAEFVTHIRGEAAFEIGNLAQFHGAIIELGIKRDDSSIGFRKLLVQALYLNKAFRQFGLQRIALLRNSLKFNARRFWVVVSH